jgi:outer membrane biogenesis lipoprotein LolB
MKTQTMLIVLLFLSFLLAACSGNTPAATQPFPTQTEPADKVTQPQNDELSTEPTTGQARSAYPELSDEQGAVTVFVTPINLDNPGERIDFDVALETHSIDLSMDLATLATLSTDTGRSVQATQWDAPRGGHHVSGTLSFPTQVDGRALLEGAMTLTLTIKDLDVPERVLTWELSQ